MQNLSHGSRRGLRLCRRFAALEGCSAQHLLSRLITGLPESASVRLEVQVARFVSADRSGLYRATLLPRIRCLAFLPAPAGLAAARRILLHRRACRYCLGLWMP